MPCQYRLLLEENVLKSLLILLFQKSPMHLISDVEKHSSAEKAGLEQGYYLACVNGEDVMHLPHNECVEKIMYENKTGSVATSKTLQLIKF